MQNPLDESDALRYRAFFDNTNDAVILISFDRKIIGLNQRTEELTGFRAEELIGESVNKLVAPEERRDAEEKHRLLSSGVQVPVYERWICRKDGSQFPVEINLFPVRDAEGKVLYLQSIARDMSKRKAAERALLESERRYRALFEQSLDTILLMNLEGYIFNANPSATLMLGYAPEALKGMHIAGLSAPEEEEVTAERLKLLLDGGTLAPYEGIARRKDDTLFPVEVRMVLVRDGQGNPLYFQSTSHNITERKNIEKQLHHLATHDPLTGLPNRALFFERLAQSLDRARQSRTKVAVLFMDLDGFKEVNDTYGHAMGDQLLQAIAQRLESRFRDGDTLARMGGDEFTLIFEEIVSLEQAVNLSERVLALMEMPFEVEGVILQIGASLGLSLFPDDGNEVEHLVSDADNAMYAAKHAGKARLVVHQPHAFEKV